MWDMRWKVYDMPGNEHVLFISATKSHRAL